MINTSNIGIFCYLSFFQVFLMNLTRLREERFSTHPEISKKKFSWSKELIFPLYYKFKNDMYGDQDLINIIFHFNPGKIYTIYPSRSRKTLYTNLLNCRLSIYYTQDLYQVYVYRHTSVMYTTVKL